MFLTGGLAVLDEGSIDRYLTVQEVNVGQGHGRNFSRRFTVGREAAGTVSVPTTVRSAHHANVRGTVDSQRT
jgi:hypothetical protein